MVVLLVMFLAAAIYLGKFIHDKAHDITNSSHDEVANKVDGIKW